MAFELQPSTENLMALRRSGFSGATVPTELGGWGLDSGSSPEHGARASPTATRPERYRDVRASPFMQPFSPNEAHEYIGRVTLGHLDV